jgi:glycosyltransferase involved in cell wall biosynthesis
MESKKRILNISNMYPSKDHSTYGIFVKRFEEAIEGENFVVSSRSVISGKGRTVASKIFKYFKFYISIAINILKKDYDLIYIHYISNSSPLLFFLKKFIRKPIAINFHGGDLLRLTGLERFTTSFTKSMIMTSDILIVPSEYFKAEVLQRFDVNPIKIHVYPSGGIDLNAFKPLDRKTLRKKEGLNESFVIGFVARIDKGKRWDLFLNAIDLFHVSYPEIKCKAVIVGNGLEVESFHKLIRDLEINDFIQFLGEKDHEHLPEIYNIMDIFVFATDNESLGLVGLEAMACGVPVIAPMVGGIKSYLLDEINGLSLESLSSQGVADAITKFFKMSDHAKSQMKERAISTPQKFEAAKVTQELAVRLSSLYVKEQQ